MTDPMPADDLMKSALLDAALTHVPFDGWSEATFRAAVSDCNIDMALARALYPRGAVDLALAFHARGDQAMVARLKREDLSSLRFRDRIATAIRFRIEAITDKEAVRRGATLFALPNHTADGARAVWSTADLIWTTLGDTSDDLNWYSKRTILSGVYGSTVLYWLGDDSTGHQATWDFIERRIDGVMQFEKLKASVQNNALLKPLLIGPNWLARQVKAPPRYPPADLPGLWRAPVEGQQ